MSGQLRVVIAVAGAVGERLAAELRDDGAEIAAVIDPGELAALPEALPDADALVVTSSREALTADVVAACDRRGVRVVPLADDPQQSRWSAAFGLAEALPHSSEGWRIADAARRQGRGAAAEPVAGRVIAVWGTHGSPGRSTVAAGLAVELARAGGRVGLIDADAHAPSLAVALGLAEDSPGIAAAARRAATDTLDAAELTRISAPLEGTDVEVLTGLNRPSRWPELTADRISGVLQASRGWVDHVVVDTAASLERDEEIVSDLEGPRRNAATLAALAAADVVVAVASADPVSIARFLRAHAELRAHIGPAPVRVVVNRLRGGALGIDARGQIRRTLSRYAGLDDVAFLPHDPRAADAALLAARPVGDASPRAPLAQGVRRLAKSLARPAEATADEPRSRRERRAARTV